MQRYNNLIQLIAAAWRGTRNIIITKPKLLLEILVSIGFMAYLGYQQTTISRQQLAISEQQQKIVEFEHKISMYEHSAHFNFSLWQDNPDSTKKCLSETIVVENKGYAITDYKINIYSFINVKFDDSLFLELTCGNNRIIPIGNYFSAGSITDNVKGIVGVFSTACNYDFYLHVQDQFQQHIETYSWILTRFHLVEVSYLDFKREENKVYLCDLGLKTDQELSPFEAEKLLKLYNKGQVTSIYNLSYAKLLKMIRENQ